ncbi:phosphotransferase [Actinomadura sp. 9N407]|uniref:phosphotransferase n=1 Tax=Actinomadura sp. 9N407 TaxID=3375154 RepID=UPI0037A32B2A
MLDRVGGGVGVVHRAADPDGRDVAIRLLPPGSYDVARMRQVRSPYVVDVLDGDGEHERPYVVSRFVPGRPLDESLPSPFQGAELRRMALGLAKALAAIHATGLVHGDLRPDHILVVDGAPVVIDFGIVPGEPAQDLRAWAANIAFAATADPRCLEAADPCAAAGEAVPAALRPLLRAASDPAGAITAAELADSVAAIKLAPSAVAPVSRTGPAAPPVVPAPAPSQEEPALASPSVRSQHEPQAQHESPDQNGPHQPHDRRKAREMAVARAWARLLTAMVVVIAVGVAIAMPLAGVGLSLVAVVALRATSDGMGRALGRTAATVPYAAVAGTVVTLGLAGLAVFEMEVDPLGAVAFGAGAAVAVLWAGPGVTGPRRQLEKVFASVARVPHRIAPAGIVLGVLALCAVVAAISVTPSLAPMYGLQSSLEGSIGRLQASLQ